MDMLSWPGGDCCHAVSGSSCTTLDAGGPKGHFDNTAVCVKICSAGSLFIVAYNLLERDIFRGLRFRASLISVSIACLVNIAGGLLVGWGYSTWQSFCGSRCFKRPRKRLLTGVNMGSIGIVILAYWINSM